MTSSPVSCLQNSAPAQKTASKHRLIPVRKSRQKIVICPGLNKVLASPKNPSSPYLAWVRATRKKYLTNPRKSRQPCLPRPFDHWAHSRMPRLLRGFSDLPHSLFGSATEAIATSRSRRLESGSARIPIFPTARRVPNLRKPELRNFLGFSEITDFGQFGQVWTMSKMSKKGSQDIWTE